LLGNGHLKGTPTVTLNEADAADIAGRIGHPGTTLTRDLTKRPGCVAFRFSGKQGSPNSLSKALAKLGPWGLLSGEKSIPKKYLLASIEQRLALLAGLVDTDGSASRAGACYHTTSKQLAQDVIVLARSVGCRASLGHDKCWRVTMRHSTERLFRTARKLAAQTKPVKRRMVDKYVKRIEPYGKGPAVCISVEAKDGLFVTRGFTLTHNTKTVAKVLHAIGRRSLFVVPSKWLLHQTIASLRECMPDAPIGQIGDGVYDVQFFTVATIQSLSSMSPVRKTSKKTGRAAHPDYATLMQSFDVGVFDEAHHIRGDGDWYRVFVDLDARFKIGVSATVFFDNTKEQESGIIWLRGTCGPIRYEVSASRLIQAGYLLAQSVKMYRVHEPDDVREARYSATLKKRCITENEHRNAMIGAIVRDLAPRKTIIIAREHAHIRAICEMLDNNSVPFRVLTGKTSHDQRMDYVDDFTSKRGPHVLVGNVLGEGVDIPDVEVVVNAEGGKDEKQTWQRQRNLTVVEGSKKAPLMVDFYDCMSKVFEKHSRARLKVYKSEGEFSAEVLECDAV
jgi:Type III restriction enzyme, res subunit/Helicase conserved C-terminal domain/LAGLIDADG-like domain